MTTINISRAVASANTIEDVVSLVNDGTCEGMEGMEFTPVHLAGQYAHGAAKESGYPIDAGAISGHLEFLAEAGAVFNESEAVVHALAIAAGAVGAA